MPTHRAARSFSHGLTHITPSRQERSAAAPESGGALLECSADFAIMSVPSIATQKRSLEMAKKPKVSKTQAARKDPKVSAAAVPEFLDPLEKARIAARASSERPDGRERSRRTACRSQGQGRGDLASIRWHPRPSGIGLARGAGGTWTASRGPRVTGQQCWIMPCAVPIPANERATTAIASFVAPSCFAAHSGFSFD